MMSGTKVFAPIVFVAACAMSSSAWSCTKTDTRWAATSNTFYIESPVSCTLSDLALFANPDVLELVDPVNHIWLLKANLSIVGGGSLILHGNELGGDVNELRLLSSNEPEQHVRIRARWGDIDIRSTHIQSWDPVSNGPDTDSSNGRANVYVESILGDDGVPRESRMDIVDSEVNHLGHYASVAYGLSWKVIGDPEVIPDLYDRVEVYGSLIGSNIHDNYMGYYSYGALGIEISGNEVANNESYGIDPHDDSDELLIEKNVVHDNGRHGIICSRRCNNIVIRDNHVYRNLHGIMLHREVVDSIVENNDVHDNLDTGIVLFESHSNAIRRNTVEKNQNGIRLSLGSAYNIIEDNIVRSNEINGLYLYSGSDTPETTDGRPSDNIFRGNVVADNGRMIKVKESDRIVFTQNTFYGDNFDVEISDATSIDIISNLYAEGEQGAFDVSKSSWKGPGVAWTTFALGNNVAVQYRVTDQQPSAAYDIFRNGTFIGSITSDDAGLAVFNDLVEAGAYRYKISPSAR